VETLAELISNQIRHVPKIGIVCGSGLGGLADVVEDKQIIKYSELEGFAVSTGRSFICPRHISITTVGHV
jgi:purine-nucleoside phosphorylase